MQFENILLRKDNHIANIYLNIPEKKNAFTIEMRADLLKAFNELRYDDEVNVVVITGSGDAFCAGGDLKRMEGTYISPVPTRQRLIKTLTRLTKAMLDFEKPIIASVNGPAVGAGMNLAMACDLIIASEHAKFGQVFVKIGLIPDMGGFYFLSSRIGIAKTKELMLLGDIFDAHDAERLGIINKVVPHEELEKETLSLATRLANGPSQAYAMIKAAMNLWPTNINTFLEVEANMQAVAFSSEDFAEGRNAFIEKRRPVFNQDSSKSDNSKK